MTKKQKHLTFTIIILGVALAGLNFLIFNNLSGPEVDRLANLFEKREEDVVESAQAESLIVDVKPAEQYKNSELRKKEIQKIEQKLPFQDPEKNYLIYYSKTSSDITVDLTGAKDLADYRQQKLHAEYRLAELGAENLCPLLVLYAPPMELKEQITSADAFSTGCL